MLYGSKIIMFNSLIVFLTMFDWCLVFAAAVSRDAHWALQVASVQHKKPTAGLCFVYGIHCIQY